jgi:hypothetical protein
VDRASKERRMTTRPIPTPGEGSAIPVGDEDDPQQAVDDRLNDQIQGVLRQGAETRAARDRDRSVEDARSAQRETAALMALIDGHAAPRER